MNRLINVTTASATRTSRSRTTKPTGSAIGIVYLQNVGLGRMDNVGLGSA